MSEFSRIARYFAPLAGPEGRGLIDDAAVLAPPAGRELVLTVDQMVQDVHFLPGDAPGLIARKLLRRNLSDLAAMGAAPLGYLLTTALPREIGADWLAAFADGLRRDQQIFGIKLFGGDSSSSPTGIVLSVTMIGHVAPGAALSRNGARAGDEVFVTGTIGDAALGLQARRGMLADVDGFLTARSLLPTPRTGLPLAGIVTAAIDISDGLVQDLGHMCKGAGLGAVIEAALVPASLQAVAFGPEFLAARLTGGDDYELLLAVPPQRAGDLKRACGELPVTKIGVFVPGPAVVAVLDEAATKMQFRQAGWEHFQK